MLFLDHDVDASHPQQTSRPNRIALAFIAGCLLSALLALSGPPSTAQAEDLIATPSDGEPTAAPRADRIAEITVSPMEALPGGTLHVTGTCTFHGHGATEAFLALGDQDGDSSFFIDLSADPISGDIDADVTVPEDTPPGAYDLFWMCALDDMVFGVSEFRPFTVLTPDSPVPTATPPAELAATVPTPTPSPSVASTAKPNSAELAATGLPTLTPALVAVGLLAAIGAMSLVFSRRTIRHRNR